MLQPGRQPVNCLAVSREGLLAVGDCGGSVWLYQLARQEGQVAREASCQVARIQVSEHFPPAPGQEQEQEQEAAGCDVLAIQLR